MPPKRVKTIPPGFIPSPDVDNKYICELCRKHNTGPFDHLLVLSSISRHIASKGHRDALQAEQSLDILQEIQVTRPTQLDYPIQLSAPTLHDTQLGNSSVSQSVDSIRTNLLEELAAEAEQQAMEFETPHWVHDEIHAADWDWREEADTLGLFDAEGVALAFGLRTQDDLMAEYTDGEAANDDLIQDDDIDSSDEEDEGLDFLPPIEHTWYPYPNKTMCVIDTLDRLPRQRISTILMKMILWAMKQSGSRDVPTFKTLRSFQTELRNKSSIKTRKFQSALGNIFYMNDIPAIISSDLANPSTRKELHFYPEEPLGPVTEVWHAEKWRKDNDLLEFLTPMIICPRTRTQIYVDEVALMSNGTYVIPKRWIIRNGEMHADAYALDRIDDTCYIVKDDKFIDIAACRIQHGYEMLERQNLLPPHIRSLNYHGKCIQNPLRSSTRGLPLYTIWVDVWHDDVSGNRSKSYNKHYNTCFTNRSLPRKFLQQEYHVHFAGTSQHASPTEQAAAVKSMIESSHRKPVTGFDVELQELCCFRLLVNALPADNPMQSELCSHIGGQGNNMCRRCNVGGTLIEKESGHGFHAIFQPGLPRYSLQTRNAISQQLLTTTKGVEKTVKDLQTQTGVKDKIAQFFIEAMLGEYKKYKTADPRRSASDIQKLLQNRLEAIKEEMLNPLLSMRSLDPHRDTPVELLHTILLGIVKYAWHVSHTSWKQDQKDLYLRRLQSTDISGTNIPPIKASYIVQYAGSLIGRQFKLIIQTAVFHMHDLVPPNVYRVWKAIGSLSTLLWIPEIDAFETYLTDVQVCINNVLDAFALLDPTKIIQKVKSHALTHALEDIRRFGPLIGQSTEIFESFNAVFRACSIQSNRRAPSRDIAYQMAAFEGAKQRLSGGYWSNGDGRWVRASASVRACFMENTRLQEHMGWVQTSPHVPGAIRISKRNRNRHSKFQTLPAFNAVNTDSALCDLRWVTGTSVTCKNGDKAAQKSWVVADSPMSIGSILIGRIVDIVVAANNSEHVIITVDRYEVSNVQHSQFEMPILYQAHDEPSFVNVASNQILFMVNVQHDCHAAQCRSTVTKYKVIERVQSTNEEQVLQHDSLNRYVLNLAAFHNAHLLRRCLPRETFAPKPIIPTQQRRQTHDTIAAAMHAKMNEKRKVRKAKREAVAAANASSTNDPGPSSAKRQRQDPQTRNLTACQSSTEAAVDLDDTPY